MSDIDAVAVSKEFAYDEPVIEAFVNMASVTGESYAIEHFEKQPADTYLKGEKIMRHEGKLRLLYAHKLLEEQTDKGHTLSTVQLIKDNSEITQRKMAENLGISSRVIKKSIKDMVDNNIIA